MKKRLLIIFAIIGLVCSHNISFAQAGNVYTVAGGGTSLADNIPATNAYIHSSTGVCVDPTGNLYVADDSLTTVRKIDHATGLISTIVTLSTGPRDLCSDVNGNIYICEANSGSPTIKKVDATTGGITIVAGGGFLTTDGIPATSHRIEPLAVYVDGAGNIYTSGDSRLYKIDGITGIITTILGNGLPVDDGDGGPATAARISNAATSISMDAAGNLYFVSLFSPRIRKIDAVTGLVKTVAGGGTSTADGILATNELFGDIRTCASDGAGNLFIADWSRQLIRRVDGITGLINTVAGMETGGSSADGTPALNANVTPFLMWLDAGSSTVYYSTHNDRVKKFSYANLYTGSPVLTTDSFATTFYQRCKGPELTMVTPHYIAGRSIKTFFGDGTSDSAIIIPGYTYGGYAIVNHTYTAAGSYTIRQYLYYGTNIEDSVTTIYNYTFCRTLPISLFVDANLNCNKDAYEHFCLQPSLAEVDSNGMAVDTVSATSSFFYNAYGNPGDIYKFKIISTLGGMTTTCPTIGYIFDTIQSAVTSYPVKSFGLFCPTSSTFDLAVNRLYNSTAPLDQWGDIFITNSSCMPVNTTVTLNFSPKYMFYSATPSPISTSSSTIIWNLSGLSTDNAAPAILYYKLLYNPSTGPLSLGDTVNTYITATPLSGDANLMNNSVIIIDTILTPYDPNSINVNPPGCINSGLLPTELQYTIHFENTGNDTAHNIYVIDTLPGFVNPSSLRIVMASHVMNIDIQSYDGRKVARFDFPNINLLDSSHHGECDGAFIYTVNTYAGLPDGVDIMNRVGIYFDYNSVVMTNEAHNTIGGCWPTGVRDTRLPLSANLYPNPVTGTLHIDLAAPANYIITNIVGSGLQHGSFKEGNNTLDLKVWSPGVYIVSLTDNKGTKSVHKIIKN